MQILTNQEQLFNAIGILGATCERDAVQLVTPVHLHPAHDSQPDPLPKLSVPYCAGMPHNLFLGSSIIQVTLVGARAVLPSCRKTHNTAAWPDAACAAYLHVLRPCIVCTPAPTGFTVKSPKP